MTTHKTYDGELLAHQSALRDKAHREGQKHRPASDAMHEDQHEAELRSDAERHLNSQQALFRAQVVDAHKVASEAEQKAVELDNTVRQLLADDSLASTVDAELAAERASLVKLTESRLRVEAELKFFRVSNDIQDEPNYPESRWLHVGLLLAMVLMEVIVNAFFYENSAGLLGGVVVAFGIAVLNIGVALMAGLGFRYKNLKAPLYKWGGWGCLALFVLCALLFNALFAAFRSQYQLVLDPSDVVQMKDAFKHAWPEAMLIFRGAPQFQDLSSFILFGLGMVLSVLAFYKGYTLDDRYPGYGGKDRRHKQALEAEHAEQDRVRRKLKELLHKRRTAIQSALSEPSTQIGMLGRRISDLNHDKHLVVERSQAVRLDFAMLVDSYRKANLAVRATAAPAYFGTPATLSGVTSDAEAEPALRKLAQAQAALTQIGDTHREALNERLRELQGDATDAQSRTMSAFLGAVHAEAELNIAKAAAPFHRAVAA